MSITRQQFDQIMDRAMENREVQRVLSQARDVVACDESISAPVLRRMDQVLDREVRNAAQALRINMTEREGNRIEHLMKDMALEDATCNAPRSNGGSRGRD